MADDAAPSLESIPHDILVQSVKNILIWIVAQPDFNPV